MFIEWIRLQIAGQARYVEKLASNRYHLLIKYFLLHWPLYINI